ncbi:MAG: hypothetical protein HC883_00165 [Bdellovibrionaceae bacterium]|nr:hypothetical protein [Pseudobdellovibrionaceae bacterium]
MTYEQQLQELENLKRQITSISAIVDSKERQVTLRESQIRQGQFPNTSAQNLQYNMRNSLGPMLTPGNIGDINSVIWPFYFTTDIPLTPLGPNETFQTGFSVTQEAAFIFMSFTKAVYLVEGEDPNDSWTYLDPDAGQPSAPGLSFTLRDGSSSRQLFNTPMLTDHYGHPRWPTKNPRPIMLLPNQVMQIQFDNAHQSNRYVPFITAFGYRMRIDEAQKLLSLVYA